MATTPHPTHASTPTQSQADPAPAPAAAEAPAKKVAAKADPPAHWPPNMVMGDVLPGEEPGVHVAHEGYEAQGVEKDTKSEKNEKK